MKKTVKRITAMGLAVTSVMGLVACGNKAQTQKESETKKVIDWSKVEKPTEEITVLVDNTVAKEGDGADEFYADLEKQIGLKIKWIRPDHNGYYTQVATAFATKDTMPDLVLLSSDYYAQYAGAGLLWDMTDAWEQSETKKSGRMISSADNVLQGLQVLGPDGQKRMYGFSPYRGNGCCTFVSVDWLTAAGMKKSDVEGKTLKFSEFYDMLTKMKNSGKVGEYGVLSAPAFIADEAPYTNYMPEFYQKADYTFYYDAASKKYVDGFSAKEMKDALTRIAKAYADGILDKTIADKDKADTTTYRNKFYKGQNGMYTYWAGSWAQNTVQNLKNNGLSEDVVYLEPIAELGKYVERIAPCWAITTHAKNPEGIFKYFIDTMLDGGRTQVSWTYGPEEAYWSVKGGEYAIGDKTYTAQEGEFHFLATIADKTKKYSKNHIDPALALATFKSDYKLGNATGDPGAAAITEIAKKNGDWFAKVSAVAVPVPMTEELSNNIGAINTKRREILYLVVQGKLTVDDGMKQYESEVGAKVKTVLDSLNALVK